jgi:hypothetical protein
MGYGVEVYTGVIKNCGDIKWFEIRGGYSFDKFGGWDLEKSTIIDIEQSHVPKMYEVKSDHEEYIYYKNSEGNLVFRDSYLQSRRTISINKVIKDLKRKAKYEESYIYSNIVECLEVLEKDKKKGLKLVLFEGT